MPPSKYTPEQRAEALAVYAEHGVREAERKTGIGHTTISRWAKAAGLGTSRTEITRAAADQNRAAGDLSRAEIRGKFLDRAHLALDLMAKEYRTHVGQQGKPVTLDHPPAADMRHLMIAAATGLDKVRLEDGEATSRKEVVERDDFDREVARLVGELEHGRTAPVPVADDGSA